MIIRCDEINSEKFEDFDILVDLKLKFKYSSAVNIF